MPDALPTDFRVGPRSCLHTLIAYRASQAVADAHALPRTPGAVAISPARARALCIGPAEWFLVNCDPHALALPGEQCAIVEQTGAFACIQIVGPAVEDLLARVCALDMREESFRVGTCGRTRLAGIAAILDRRAPHELDSYVPRSYVSYLLAALNEAARSMDGMPTWRSSETG
jgi:sarcosine oxidase subunit gamma